MKHLLISLQRWSLRQIDSYRGEPLYDGIETDQKGDWVRYEDVKIMLHKAE